MRRVLPLLFLALLAVPAVAQQNFQSQSTTFTFDATTAITSYNGSDPANPPYPQDMGAVNLGYPYNVGPYGPGPVQPGISLPWQLNYLNNGDLNPCQPMSWQDKQWQKRPDGTLGDGTQAGDTFNLPGATTCPYFTGEYGTDFDSNNTYDSFSVVAKFVTVQVQQSCPRYHICHGPYYVYVNKLSGGQGVVNQIVTQ